MDDEYNQQRRTTAGAIDAHNDATEEARRRAANAYARQHGLIGDGEDLLDEYSSTGTYDLRAVQSWADGNKKDWEEVQKAIDAIAEEETSILTDRRTVLAGIAAFLGGAAYDRSNVAAQDGSCDGGVLGGNTDQPTNDWDLGGNLGQQNHCAAEGTSGSKGDSITVPTGERVGWSTTRGYLTAGQEDNIETMLGNYDKEPQDAEYVFDEESATTSGGESLYDVKAVFDVNGSSETVALDNVDIIDTKGEQSK